MARAGRRYTLLIYERMLNRWWPATLTMGLALLALSWAVYRQPGAQFEAWRWLGLLGLSGFVLLVSIFLFTIRKSAYVQPFSDHLRIVTPFLRLNISYRRLRRSSTAEMRALFPPGRLSGWKREIIAPLAGKTAVILELNAYPVSPTTLRFFLSPFFFKDNTPHFVILVDDWMRFSTEMESLRAGGGTAASKKPVDRSILSRLPRRQ